MEPDLVDEWITEGYLPNLERLIGEGASGTVDIEPMSSARQWTTHFTGVEQETHGIQGFRRRNNDSEGGTPDVSELINMSDIRLKTYPEIMSNRGVSTVLLNPIIMWPPVEVEDGICVSGNLTHPDSDNWAWPREIQREAERRDYQIGIKYSNRPYGWIDDDLMQEVSLDTLESDMFDVLEKRIEFSKYLLLEESPDFFYVLLKSIDAIQHVFWAQMLDENHTHSDTIREAYTMVDEFVGWVMENVDDANIVVFSDHGAKSRSVPPRPVRMVSNVAKAVLPSIPASLHTLYDKLRTEYHGKTGTETDEDEAEVLSGTHSAPAFWAAAGPQMEAVGRGERIEFTDLSVMLLALTGTPVPDDYVGELPHFVEPSVGRKNIELETVRPPPGEAQITDRLYNLGYAEMVESEIES
jgi:hypothetical protein